MKAEISRELCLLRSLVAAAVLMFVVAGSWAVSKAPAEVIVANGIGSSEESAIRNAAENALMQIVGTLVETQKSVEKNIEIRGAIKEQTKEINKRNSQYSQGSIQSIDVLEASESGGISRVTVSVEVRVEEFSAYLARTALAEADVGDDIFAKARERRALSKMLVERFVDDVLVPLQGLVSWDVEVGSVNLISDRDQLERISEFARTYILEGRSLGPTDRWLSVPVKVAIKPENLSVVYDQLAELPTQSVEGSDIQTASNLNVKTPFIVIFAQFVSPSVRDRDVLLLNKVFDKTGLWPRLPHPHNAKEPRVKGLDGTRVFVFPSAQAEALCSATGAVEDLTLLPDLDFSVVDAQGNEILGDLLTTDKYSVHGPRSSRAFLLPTPNSNNGRDFPSGAYASTFLYYYDTANAKYSSGRRECYLGINIEANFELIFWLSKELMDRASDIELRVER